MKKAVDRVMPDRKAKPVLRIAHITDSHVQPEKQAAKGFQKCLEEAQAHSPDMLFFGGDMVMDCLGADEARVKAQWEVFQGVIRANTNLPIVSVIGNHDVWGWGRADHHPCYGKAVAMEQLKLTQPYRSFDRAGWHFIMLDSTHRKRGTGYTAKLDETQFEWLAEDLRNTPSDCPVLVMSHIPILSVSAYFDGDNEKRGNWHVPGAWMHIDARRIKDLFCRHPNVKVCLSGHIHLVDRVDYLGVRYFCNGAACGSWWNGPYQEFGAGYAIVDLFSDGSVMNEYFEFPWTPVA